jgi:hypothetical protein
LKYTFKYREKFDEPNDDWLKCIEATSDELLGTYTRAEDDALSSAFGGRGKKRLNRVFDAIGFIYPDYCYPLRRQGKKRKIAALVTTVVLKGKKIKFMTHGPRYIETAVVPEFGEGTSSAAEAKQAASAAQSAEGLIVVPKIPIVGPAEAKYDAARESELEKTVMMPKILSPPVEAELPKVTKAPATTPKRRRMASMLDAVIETTKALTPASAKKLSKLSQPRPKPKLGLQCPLRQSLPCLRIRLSNTLRKTDIVAGQDMTEKVKSPAPEDVDYIIRHASGKNYPKKKS